VPSSILRKVLEGEDGQDAAVQRQMPNQSGTLPCVTSISAAK
jgi:hypothetical protein